MDPEDILPPKIMEVTSQITKLSEDQVKNIVNQPFMDRCLGALYGAMFGDALGSFCEFSNHVHDPVIQRLL